MTTPIEGTTPQDEPMVTIPLAVAQRLRAIEDAARAVVDGGTFDYTFTPEQTVLIDALREALR